MGKMDAALSWAARGFRVFPLEHNGKVPVHDTAWYDVATSDPDQIRKLWTDPVLGNDKGYNIGVDCTGFVVIDIDVKDGKNGIEDYANLGGHYDTLTVRTPTGGYHCYFAGPDSGNASLSPSVDVRSHHGYVVAPGSTIGDRAYEVVKDGVVAGIPGVLASKLTVPYERATAEHVALDTPAAIQAARNFLNTAPPAIEGQRGDETTFTTAARLVREMSLSVDVAFQLMLEHFNPRCMPPWDADELHAKVQNAAEYGTAINGRLDPAQVYAGIEVAPPPSMFEQSSALGFGNAIEPAQLPRRPWLVDRMLMRGETTMLLAPGASGKSSLSLAIAAHLAVGRPFGPYAVSGACKTVLYNGEDNLAEQSRRLAAVCQQYQLDYHVVKSNIMLLSTELLELKLAMADGRRAYQNEAMVRQLIEVASAPDVGLLIYDPFVDVHDLDETDNPQMNFVMSLLQKIAREANVANLALHHTSKGGTKQEERVGNADIGRGASAIINKSRIAFTLLNASMVDCEQYGLQDHERLSWVRLDDAKMNLALRSDKATWFRKAGVQLLNGDTVGVLHMQELTRDVTAMRQRLAQILVENMELNNMASVTITQAVAIVKQNEPLMANKTDADVKSRLLGWFSGPVEWQGRSIKPYKEEGKSTVVLTLF